MVVNAIPQYQYGMIGTMECDYVPHSRHIMYIPAQIRDRHRTRVEL